MAGGNERAVLAATTSKNTKQVPVEGGGGASKKKIKKRSREDGSSVENNSLTTASTDSSKHSLKHHSKKPKMDSANPIIDITGDDDAATDPQVQMGELTVEDEVELPTAEFDALRAKYEVTDIHIISSSKIEAKVTRVLEKLKTFSFVPPYPLPNIVYLHATASNAPKLISILEIAKRDIGKDGFKWYQYNHLGEIKEEKKREQSGNTLGGHFGGHKLQGTSADADSMMVDDDGTPDSSSFSFETMKTPIERAIAGKPKVRVVPELGIYLSRVRVEELKQRYGEQSNDTRPGNK